jgi:iron(III) transport system substrate-binding protein
MVTRRSFVRLAALAPLAAAGCPPRVGAQTPDAEWRKVVETARKEGKVVVYNGAVGTPALPKVLAAFEAKYGIRAELLEARASELRERIRTEQAAGKVLGDVSHNGSTTTALQLVEGTFVPYGALPNAGRPVAPFQADGTRVPVYVIQYGILVNTDMVELAEQQPHMNRELRGNYPRIARGEYPLYVPYTLPDILELKGLRVKAILPEEGRPYVRFDGAIFKGAPRPSAARLLLDFFLSDEAQLIYGNLGFVMTVGGLEGKVTAEARGIAQAKLLGTTDPKRQDEMLKLAKSIYK